MIQALLPFLAFLFVLCFPSTNLQFFDGLPFSALPEFAVLALAAPFLLFRELRLRQADHWKRWKIRPAWLWIFLASIFVFKIALFASGEHSGFAGCYRSDAEPTTITHEDLPYRECERSYGNPFDRFSATRLDETIWFGQDNWNLVFLNTSRYNFYEWEPGNIPRPRIPIVARWSGSPDIPSGSPIRIAYSGEGTVVWGDVRVILPPAYEETAVVDIDPPSVESPLTIEYAFDDGSRSGQDAETWGPRASLKVAAVENGIAIPLSARSAKLWRILALIADGMIALWVFASLPALWQSLRRDLIGLLAFSAGMILFSFIPAAPVVRGMGLTVVLAAILAAHVIGRPFRGISLYFIAAAAGFAILRVWSSGYATVLLRSAGNDPLSYESQAFSILATGSWRGGESLFYNVPGYRYIKFLEHALFGDGDMLYAAVQLALYFGGVFRLFRDCGVRALPAARKILAVGLGCALIFLGGYYLAGIIREGLSEYDSWIILLWATPMVYGTAAVSAAGIAAGIIALAASFTIRPDLLPGILWILFLAVAGTWRRHARTILPAGILALGVALLPLAHNIVFGQQWVLTTTSSAASVNYVLSPSTWLAFGQGDPVAAEAVKEQLGMLFLITGVPRSQLPTMAVLGFFLAAWLAVSVYSAARRGFRDVLWLALPVVLLMVRLFYVVNTYYPRHIIAAYLLMAVTAALVVIREAPTSPAAKADAVE
jgi:hypothetical protein